ncbi:MAG: hypothetical protein KGK07_01140 [Chloroflexota bacterium]|nr:hypothetical protein [Chloroflexota bacterium]
MAAVFAGFVVGYGMALVAAPLGAIALVRANRRSGMAQRIAPQGTNIVALSVVVHFAAVMLFTAVGLVLGMVLAGLDGRRPQGALGSPNLLYTVTVIVVACIIALPAAAVPPLRRPAAVGALVFVAAFGWALPWLARLGG